MYYMTVFKNAQGELRPKEQLRRQPGDSSSMGFLPTTLETWVEFLAPIWRLV